MKPRTKKEDDGDDGGDGGEVNGLEDIENVDIGALTIADGWKHTGLRTYVRVEKGATRMAASPTTLSPWCFLLKPIDAVLLCVCVCHEPVLANARVASAESAVAVVDRIKMVLASQVLLGMLECFNRIWKREGAGNTFLAQFHT